MVSAAQLLQQYLLQPERFWLHFFNIDFPLRTLQALFQASQIAAASHAPADGLTLLLTCCQLDSQC